MGRLERTTRGLGTRSLFFLPVLKLTLHAYAWKVDHYLPLLIQWPGAFPYTKPVRQWKMPGVYREFLKALSWRVDGSGMREFLQVLALGRTCGRENLELAVSQALAENRADAEQVRQLASRGNYAGSISPTPSIYPHQVRVILPDLGCFDELRLVSVSGGGV